MLETLGQDPGYEKIFGKDGFKSFNWFRRCMARAGSVAQIEDSYEDAVGTGFVVRGSDLHRGLGDASVSREYRELLGLPNVVALGPRPQAVLPDYLRHCQVALVPFADNRHTRASLPLKLWEYLAAGLPVVTRALPQFEALAAEGLVRTAKGPSDFAAAVADALQDPPERGAWRLERARAHDWSDRMDVLCEAVDAALARAAGREASA